MGLRDAIADKMAERIAAMVDEGGFDAIRALGAVEARRARTRLFLHCVCHVIREYEYNFYPLRVQEG